MSTTPTISKVVNVQATGTFDSSFGLLYKFEYEMADGTIIVANHKSADAFFKAGSEVEYLVKNDNKFGKSGSVGKPKAPHVGGQPFTQPTATNQNQTFLKGPDVQDMIIRQSSVKAAIDFKVGSGSNMSLEEMLSTAEVIYEYCKTGKIPSSQLTKAPF